MKYEPSSGGSNPACNSGSSAGGCSSAKVIGLIVFITFAGMRLLPYLFGLKDYY